LVGSARAGSAADIAVATGVLPTIADVLHLDAVTAAAPEVLAGAEHLQRSVRWVHVTSTESVVGFVSGGELLLSTGVGWTADDHEFDGYVAELEEVGIAGLILELGARYANAPESLVAACAARGIPLIVLHRQARFIAITEAVHSRIIIEQTNALRARDEIHALFTELSLRGSPAEFIVSQLGRVLGSPVVLEDLAHRVIVAETLDDDLVLAGWEQASREAHRETERDASADAAGATAAAAGDAATQWLIVPVEARGTRWGYLVALPGAAHPAGRTNVLEQGAVALALSRLADRDSDEWVLHSERALLASLLEGRYRSEDGLRARFEACGLPVRGRRLIGVALAATTTDAAAVRAALVGAVAGPHDAAHADVPGTAALVGVAPGGGRVLIAAVSLPEFEGLTDRAMRRFGEAVASGSATNTVIVAVGSESRDVRGLAHSLNEATELLSSADGSAGAGGPARRGVIVVRSDDKPLLRLVTALGGDPRLQEHSERMLRPLIEHDLATGGDLLEVLGACLAHPGNRTTAAAASHLSRSVFYQRIALIEQLLGTDLDDGETLSALHAALFARRQAGSLSRRG
jgi:purine catabolism regulator